jgi:hypothetical protein
MRHVPWLFLLLAVGCSSGPPGGTAGANDRPGQRWQQQRDLPVREATVAHDRLDEPQARNNLKAQAEEAGRAAAQENHARMAELTLPALIEKAGGRALYIKKLESVAAEIKGKGFALKKCTIGQPSELVQVGGDVYATVPTELEMSGPQGATGRQPSYMIAVSRDGGATWKFIDGFGAGGDREKVKTLLPNFPEQLQVPAVPPPVWNKAGGGFPPSSTR